MRPKRKKALVPLIIMIFMVLFQYPFMIIRGEWGFLLMDFFFVLGVAHFLDEYFGKRYMVLTFSIIMSIEVFTLTYVNSVRNASDEKINIVSKVKWVGNDSKYVHFGLEIDTTITFKSYDYGIRESFKRNIEDEKYNKVIENIGKIVKIQVIKSHLDWYKRYPAKFFISGAYPLELDSCEVL
jgi:hypothetical protein